MLRLINVAQVWDDLCLTEKLEIINEDPKLLSNKQSELVSKCRNKNKFILVKIK